jgi:hypothetical protein
MLLDRTCRHVKSRLLRGAPFNKSDEGLFAEEAAEAPSAAAAISRARAVAARKAGAVAFARTGDPSTGEFTAAEVLATFGEVPNDLSEY